ncbi:MAG: DUF433 domain-containing protein [Actinomycetota bacterium]|jgi:uncharacterized protein (DUF433 family)|nr:DUF433 domain-containing protein [Actinomycetota bacterium]
MGTLQTEVVAVLLKVQPEPVPLLTDVHGVVRVGPSRVTLESVVHAFRAGATAEEIVQQYPSVELADVYAVVTYYLRHREEVDGYLRDREVNALAVREANEARFDPAGIRDRLLDRRTG